MRLLQLGLRFGGGLALALLVGSRLIPNLFSKDIEVIALAQRVIPLLAASLVRLVLLASEISVLPASN